ncbi:gamma-glutamyl-gamma-aminobutyrate hydrolase family protein [Sinorhizobium medicae]|nr:gamma-glutamyl-gamma-aminobutyrate hydrolase family protein [Sinorhizobium medicae]MDX1237626.1 gamma-glutamyl-gamma-aminobutyrate hydrolase family protein [Sinorhizobium medicae]
MPHLPRTGITPDINDLVAPETEFVVMQNYADAASKAGGLPFLLPYREHVDDYLDAIDGSLVTGGMFDIDPALYRQTARKDYVMKPARTNFERALIEAALSRGMPIVGICNGMQLLAVCLGGALVQDIPAEIEGALEHKPNQSASIAPHQIYISGTSRYLQTPQGELHQVNSVHHQSVLPSDAYQVIAVSPDGVVEALEKKDGGFAIGVQWHPEYGVADIDTIIFEAFLAKARGLF